VKDDASAAGQRSSSAALGRLRLQAGPGIEEITGTTLEAVVPGFADAAVIYTAESLVHSGVPATARPVRQDASGRVAVRRAGTRFSWGGPGDEDFPSGEAVVFAGDSPHARCVRGGEPVAFPRPSEGEDPGGRELSSRYASFLAVPLEADGAVVGIVVLAREPVRPAFGGSDIDGIARIAACAGNGIAAVAALERHQAISSALQQGLIAPEPAPPENLDVAGKCLPADGHLVGGDWFDVIALPGDRTGIVVGDVMGHGAEAAAVMAQLRAAARVLAQMDSEPADLLARLNRLIPTLTPEPLATCIYAVIDPPGESCTLAVAGHLPPILAIPGPVARVLDLPSGMSLGVGPAEYRQARIRLKAGAVIAFYSDGLVESRTRPFDQGITVLRTELAGAEGALEGIRDAVIRSLADDPEDDVTLILARIPGSGWP
jgi:hypothetical protein